MRARAASAWPRERRRSSAGTAGTARASAGAGLAELQRAAGNRAVSRLLAGGGVLQTKLVVGAPGDAYEQEADHVAQAVTSGASAGAVSAAAPAALRRCACGGSCPSCRKGEEDEDDARVLRRAPEDRPGAAAVAPPIVQDVLGSAGQPLDAATRAAMEPRFGHDFSAVRVHLDERAAAAARAVHAQAYTVGRDLVFGAGRYAPGTAGGDRLIAHELAHVVQQRGGLGPRLQPRVVDDDKHLPCRAAHPAADVAGYEAEAATRAEGAATALRARPLAEATRALLWTRFGLDYNEPRVRCRFVPELADRFAGIASGLRDTDCTYNCAAAGEPSSNCDGTNFAHTYVGLTRNIDLCSSFWGASQTPLHRAETILHEWAHYEFGRRGLWDEVGEKFDNAECYAAFAFEVTGGTPVVWDDTLCPPRTTALPALDAARIDSSCPRNVFVSLPSLAGGYLFGLPGKGHYGTVSGGFDLQFPLTRMHDWELTLGPRFTAAIPSDPDERTAYLVGLRVGLQFRYRPWRFTRQLGGYVEGGAAFLPGATGQHDQASRYAVGGVSAGLGFGKQTALQLFLNVGGGLGVDTSSEKTFGIFQAGLGAALQW